MCDLGRQRLSRAAEWGQGKRGGERRQRVQAAAVRAETSCGHEDDEEVGRSSEQAKDQAAQSAASDPRPGHRATV